MPPIPFKKLQMAVEMVQVWNACKVPLQPSFFSPPQIADWIVHLWVREQLKEACQENKQTAPPMLEKKNPFAEWINKLELWSMNSVSLQDCGLHWCFLEDPIPIDVPNGKLVPDLVNDRCHLQGCISVDVDDILMRYACHNDPVFAEVNLTLLQKLEEALKGTSYLELIAKFRETRDCRRAWKQLITINTDSGVQYKNAQMALTWLKSTKWKDAGSIALKLHVGQHRQKHNEIPQLSKGNINVAVLDEYEKCYHLLHSLVTKEASFVATHQRVQKDFKQKQVKADFELIAAELIRHNPVAKKSTSKDGLHAHFAILSTSADEDYQWEKKYYSKSEFNCLKGDYGEQFIGPLMAWRQTLEGKKAFNKQRAAALAKGGKGSQSTKKRKGEFSGMSKAQVKKSKAMKAELKVLESDDYRKGVYEIANTMAKSLAEKISGSPSSSTTSSSTDSANTSFENFNTVLTSFSKVILDKKEE